MARYGRGDHADGGHAKFLYNSHISFPPLGIPSHREASGAHSMVVASPRHPRRMRLSVTYPTRSRHSPLIPASCQMLTSSTALMRFTGAGIQIYTFDVGQELPAAIVIDGKPCNSVESTEVSPVNDTDVSAYQTTGDWDCQGLGVGTHELKIQNDRGYQSYQMFFCLDPGASTIPLVPTTSSSIASGVSDFSVTATTFSSYPSTTHTTSLTATSSSLPSPSASPPSTSQPAATTRPIVAGTVGGALFLMAVAACWYLLRLRRRRRDRQEMTPFENIRPFVQSLRRRPPRTRSPSSLLEKPSNETLSVTVATGPTYASSQAAASSPPAVVHPARGHRPDARSAPSKSSKHKRSTPLPSGPSTRPVVLPQSEIATGQTGIPTGLDRARSHAASMAETSSVAPPLGRRPSHELGRVLSSAPPEVQSGVMRIMRSLLSQRAWQGSARTEVDSGMRFVEDSDVPPPEYTRD
ncbi:hypothetical protein OH76DRAFT_717873 [Lentinus brumalis]|uniref:Uncharacterized protein n=1 Tax=Lentinus brumalis TaxID=2498619 RepID=A0A371D5K4_9APHY|nr:hypothetical protein OH76DRAFT_717873 [Polyporus brumalis]